ncbi:hypothetical protein [Parablautia sp. Marseille-Q6255]|nr:hypothetical protein [Parablautia sp. Marseille-Q6255]
MRENMEPFGAVFDEVSAGEWCLYRRRGTAIGSRCGRIGGEGTARKAHNR